MSEVFVAVEPTGLLTTDVEILRLDDAETLRCWRNRFMARASEAEAMLGTRFVRMWKFYLALCGVSFRRRTNILFQLQLCRRLDTLPITRDYLYAASGGPAKCDAWQFPRRRRNAALLPLPRHPSTW